MSQNTSVKAGEVKTDISFEIKILSFRKIIITCFQFMVFLFYVVFLTVSCWYSCTEYCCSNSVCVCVCPMVQLQWLKLVLALNNLRDTLSPIVPTTTPQ